ncbi:hypothetical protein TWF696_008874 [Orbilia brochopaga]|uniref:RRM domain-containing protein n=1 Tax=Orbilia brochopaga TaxID=3140254 RepID=A0AAV9UEH8_9PEZI
MSLRPPFAKLQSNIVIITPRDILLVTSSPTRLSHLFTNTQRPTPVEDALKGMSAPLPPPPGQGSPPPKKGSGLPPRPPPSIHPSTHAFAGFRPRQVASSSHPVGAPPVYPGVPGVPGASSYGANGPPGQHPAHAPGYGYGAQQQPPQQTSYSAAPQTTYSAAPIANANPRYMSNQSQHPQSQYGQGNRGGHRNFQNRNANNGYTSHHNASGYPPLDPDMEAQIAEQQSIYDPARRAALAAAAVVNATTTSAGYDPNASLLPEGTGQTPAAQPPQKKATVVRSGGGQTWQDDTLLEWDPAHFRLFVGNLAGEVTDESLLKAFAIYPSVQKARVVRDKRTTKSRGFGFVAFQDGDDYFKAAREMQGKYIGSHPVLLRKATTEIRPTVIGNKKNKNNKTKGSGGGGGGGAGNAVLGKKDGGGVVKVKKEKGPKLLG